MNSRRCPPPWSVEEQEAYFVVRDHDGQQLACVYFEDELGRRSVAKLLTNDEVRRIAANVLSTHTARIDIALRWCPRYRFWVGRKAPAPT
jgi:hypothetical protein